MKKSFEMRKAFLALMFFALAAHAQQREQVAIINTVDDNDSIMVSDLNYLTAKLREIAVDVLSPRYGVMTTESIVAFLGSQERAEKECSESSCLADLGKKVNADYVSQGHIGRFSGSLTIEVKLYNSKSGNLVGSFTGNSQNLYGLSSVLEEKAPDMFKKINPAPEITATPAVPAVPAIPAIPAEDEMSDLEQNIADKMALGKSDLEKKTDYLLDNKEIHVVNISSEPSNANLNFDGVAIDTCIKTPCRAAIAEGKARIIAELDGYETADTIVYINRSNQNVHIELKRKEIPEKPGRWNLGIGGMAGTYFLSSKIYKDKNNEEGSGKINAGFSIGLITGFSFTSRVAFLTEFYYTYRTFENKECSQNCTEITEHALEIPLLIKWNFYNWDSNADSYTYLEFGALYGVPMKTTVHTSSTYINRERQDFGIAFGMGVNLNNFLNIGLRTGIYASNYVKDADSKFMFVGGLVRAGLL